MVISVASFKAYVYPFFQESHRLPSCRFRLLLPQEDSDQKLLSLQGEPGRFGTKATLWAGHGYEVSNMILKEWQLSIELCDLLYTFTDSAIHLAA